MTEKEIAKSPEKTQRSDHSDRASHQTAQEAVVGDDKNQSLHHKAKLSDNQHNLSDPALLTPKEGESIEDYRKRVESIQNNRFEITGLEEGTNSPQDQNDKMTTAEVKALGGKDAEMMFNAINKMPEGPEKDQAKEAIKASYTEVLSDNPHTDPSKSKPMLEGHISNTPESDTTEKIGWLDAAQKISQLPLDKQLQVIGAGLSAGITELNHQQRERSIGAVIGTVQGVGEVATNLGKIADFSAYCILGDDRAVAMGAEFGEALGKTIVGGVRLFEGAHHYLNDVGKAGYEGDYTKVFRDVDNLGKHLDKAWSELPPREQARIVSKLGTELAADGLVGLGAAKTAGKVPGQLTKILDTVSNDAQKLHKAGKVITERSVRAIEEAVDPVIESVRQKLSPRYAHATAYGTDQAPPGTKLADHIEQVTQEIKENFEALHHKMSGQGFRGDHEPYSPINSKSGLAKSYINEAGDLTPADPVGLFKGKPVDVVHHLCGGFYKHHKKCSPFTSFSETGEIISKYGQRFKIKVDLKGMEQAIESGELTGVEIISHDKVLQMITDSPCAPYSKKLAMSYASKDREILIRGVIPKRFFTIEDMHK